MDSKITSIKLQVDGMTCAGCELRIENALKKLNGLTKVNASYSNAIVTISYSSSILALDKIIGSIEQLDYKIKNKPKERTAVNVNNSRSVMRKVLRVNSMTGPDCESLIEGSIKKLSGVIDINVMFKSSNVYVTYDSNVITLEQIAMHIEKLGYSKINKPQNSAILDGSGKKPNEKEPLKKKSQINQILGIGIIVLAAYIIINNTIGFNFSFIPQINQSMGYGILFVVGLITSIHCVAMCGGINLSQCVSYKQPERNDGKLSKLKPSLMYNLGRVISYTLIGGLVGVLGSAVSFSSTTKGIIGILAGLFMVIMGLNMLNIFPWLRKISPRMPKVLAKKINNGKKQRGPLVVGLLNGLMPCGPLQSMQLYALGTGSFLAGALSMFLFSIGTMPLMFGFGALGSLLNSKFTHKMMKVSAALVLILGIIMVNRGLNLSGVNLVAYAAPQSVSSENIAKIEGDVQVINTRLLSNSYTPIIVQKGIPVKWDISADSGDINGCNGTLVIPEFNIVKQLAPGDNIIEFTPDSEGNITYTCSMGMITSVVKVVSDVASVSNSDIDEANSSSNSAHGCCVR